MKPLLLVLLALPLLSQADQAGLARWGPEMWAGFCKEVGGEISPVSKALGEQCVGAPVNPADTSENAPRKVIASYRGESGDRQDGRIFARRNISTFKGEAKDIFAWLLSGCRNQGGSPSVSRSEITTSTALGFEPMKGKERFVGIGQCVEEGQSVSFTVEQYVPTKFELEQARYGPPIRTVGHHPTAAIRIDIN